jgi:hypothetical protein
MNSLYKPSDALLEVLMHLAEIKVPWNLREQSRGVWFQAMEQATLVVHKVRQNELLQEESEEE